MLDWTETESWLCESNITGTCGGYVYPDILSSRKHLVGKKLQKTPNPSFCKSLFFHLWVVHYQGISKRLFFLSCHQSMMCPKTFYYKSASPTSVKHDCWSPADCWLISIWISIRIHTCIPIYTYIHTMIEIFIILLPRRKKSQKTTK